MLKLNAAELRTTVAEKQQFDAIKKNPVYLIIDNVLDTYNIGAIFRLADAVAAEMVLLCGSSETPPHTRIKKASINTTEWVRWQHFASAKDAIDFLRQEVPHIRIYSVELDQRSVPYDSIEYTFPVGLVVGHESDGVSDEAMRASDGVVEIPMWGVNQSMNVMVSLAVVLFEVMKNFREQS